MQTVISNPKFSIKEVGKIIKGSKKVFVWEFENEGQPYKLEFFHSKCSNKRRLNLNGNNILDTKDKGKDFKFNFIHLNMQFCLFQVTPTTYDLVINEVIFSRLLENDKPSPEASVKQVNDEQAKECEANEEEIKYYDEVNAYPDLSEQRFDIFKSYVPDAIANRQTMIDEIFGIDVEPKKLANSINIMNSVSTAQTANTANTVNTGNTVNINAHSEVKSTGNIKEESKDSGQGSEDVKNLVPHRCYTSKEVNLLEFEPVVPKKKISEMLGEIDFFAENERQGVDLLQEVKSDMKKKNDVNYNLTF
jgi:hypothetical protein